MGYGNYELQKTKYWRVYGNTEISDEIYNRFLEDRKKMRNMLEKKSLDIIKKSSLNKLLLSKTDSKV